MRIVPILCLALLGCPPAAPTGTSNDSDIPIDTDISFGGHEGNLSLLRTYGPNGLESAELVGIFANDTQGFLNLGQCLKTEETGFPCFRELPDRGQTRPFDGLDRFVPTSSFYQYVGLDVRLGGYFTSYVVGDRYSYYDSDVTDQTEFSGPAVLRLGVEWGPYRQPDVVTIPPGLDVISPRNDETIRVFSNERSFPFVWEEDPGAEMYLIIENLDEDIDGGLILHFADTGSYNLDFTELGFSGSQDLRITLARWSFDELDVNGNNLIVHTTAEMSFQIEYIDVGLRVPIQPSDGCDIEPLRAPLGRFYGDLTGYNDDFQEVVCLQSFDTANGNDGELTVTVPPRHRLDLRYRQVDANASMYLLESCDPEFPVCIQGEDRNPGRGPETLQRFNPSDTEEERYVLVLDAAEPFTGGLFFLDHDIIEIPEPQLENRCADAETAPPIQPGEYYSGSMDPLSDDLDPGFTGCTNTSLVGPDGVLPIEVPAGSTLEITVSMPEGDPAIYLLDDCTDETSCAIGSDTTGSIETLIYDNTAGADHTYYLVIDSHEGAAFFLTINLL